ncbi:hypothetical protein O181_047539 [Austropuccinia psidii MF-1]|uniref:Uncharacterized protein n=1 Tax=Austropuccinia psidii MF-1 TaxID=1389203 RepID=A0A9Q3DR77_9BASI|nr:hypothetical protein [Austropuccinia psidii MF-1]
MGFIKHKNDYQYNSEDKITTNKVSENNRGNSTVNISSNTAYQIPFNPLIHTYNNNIQSHFLSSKEYISYFASKTVNKKTIKKANSPSTDINRSFSTNQPDTIRNEIYEEHEQNPKPKTSCTKSSTNKIGPNTMNAMFTKNNDNNISEEISYKPPSLAIANRNTSTLVKNTNNINLNNNSNLNTSNIN